MRKRPYQNYRKAMSDMKFRAWFCAVQSPKTKPDESAIVRIVIETYRDAIDVNEILDMRDAGHVVIEVLPTVEQQKLPVAAVGR